MRHIYFALSILIAAAHAQSKRSYDYGYQIIGTENVVAMPDQSLTFGKILSDFVCACQNRPLSKSKLVVFWESNIVNMLNSEGAPMKTEDIEATVPDIIYTPDGFGIYTEGTIEGTTEVTNAPIFSYTCEMQKDGKNAVVKRQHYDRYGREVTPQEYPDIILNCL